MKLTQQFQSGSPWIWLTAGAVSISLISVLGLLLLIGWKGLIYFWPAPLYQWQTEDGHTLVGQLYAREKVTVNHLLEMGISLPEDAIAQGHVQRLNIKVANRDIYQADFLSILDIKLSPATLAHGWVVLQRTHDGQFYGKPIGFESTLISQDKSLSPSQWLATVFGQTQQIRAEIEQQVRPRIRELAHQLTTLRLLDPSSLKQTPNQRAERQQKEQQWVSELAEAEQRLESLRATLDDQRLLLQDMAGDTIGIPMSQVLDYWYPNEMTHAEKVIRWLKHLWDFLSDSPRDSNSEGGVFPAIFGTVLLVLIMSVIVMPLGVIAAVYLHEYAKDNAFTRLIRVAVINLAGVPSIVYGVFGLGFFVYTIGASIDNVFYADSLPAPTFGTPGLLWAALTLAVLTLPVVIVTTEEGLTRIPPSVRYGSLALGATQFETIWRIVLPMASPAMITGLILAIARAAGEVAPLMLVGAVKLASNLPVDSEFPFVHLERKFMHLGFHIYDVGFQTTNIEAARPLVYATAFLLVTVVVMLNLTAIHIRNNLREKYRTLGQD